MHNLIFTYGNTRSFFYRIVFTEKLAHTNLYQRMTE